MHTWQRLQLVLLLSLFPLVSFAQQVQVNPLRPDIVEMERKAASAKMTAVSSELTDAYDLKYNRFRWAVDPAVKYITGSVTSYFEPVGANMDTLYFDLSDSLTVDSVHYHGNAASFVHLSGELLRIVFPATITLGTLDSVSVWYHGAPVGTGFGSFIQDQHDSIPIIWTLSEPYGGKDWMPCKNGITDKIDSLDMYVTTPAGNKVAGNGVLVEVIPGMGENTYHWRHRYPIATYLIAFAVTNYVEYSNYVPFGGDMLEILNYVFPEDSAHFAYYTPEMIGAVQLYDSLFGIYPFQDEKYGHAQFGWGGGMEHQTMSFVINPDFELGAHELAHQWFGDKVTCGSWQDIWLNESWATYCSGLCYEFGLGTLPWMDFKRFRRDFAISAPDGSVWCDDTTSVNRIFNGRLSYTKGAMVLHQLRWLIGDSAFFQGVRNYLSDPVLAYDFVRTDDFQQHLEASSGRSLNSYFSDWVYGQGYPTYTVVWSQSGNTVSVEFSQTASMPGSVPFFALPIPIRLDGNGQSVTVVFDNTSNGQIFTANVPFSVDSIVFDPEIWLLANQSVIAANDEMELAAGMEVFPNPTNGFVNIRGQGMKSATLIDLAGRSILKTDLHACVGTQRMDLPLVPAGIYLLRIESAGKQQTFKLRID